jgi:hypothetical protein
MRIYRRLVESEAEYILSRQDASGDPRTDGFIFIRADEMVPYFANQAATALALTKHRRWLPAVTRYLLWYFRHLNWPDDLGLYGTTYDYKRVDGKWQRDLAPRIGNQPHEYDSVDSYAATCLTLLRAYLAADGDPALLQAHGEEIQAISELLVQMIDPADGLSIAKPTYPVKFLMDNCEVNRGLRDASWLFRVLFKQARRATRFARLAAANRAGILTALADGSAFSIYKAGQVFGKVTWSKWYPDAVSQLFPVIHGVIDRRDPRARLAYRRLNRHFPRWHSFAARHESDFPWALVAYAATVMGKTADFERYRESAERVYIDAGHPWRWQVVEAAWFLLACLRMDHLASGWGAYP